MTKIQIIKTSTRGESELLYTAEDVLRPFFFFVAYNEYNRGVEEAKQIAEIGHDMFVDDTQDIPIGIMADFLGEYKQIEDLLCLSTRERLSLLYQQKNEDDDF